MKQQTLIHSSILAAIIIAVVIGIGIVTGFPGVMQESTGTPVSETEPAPYISIDPVSEKTTGDLLTVTGTTNLPAGTNLMVSTGNYGGNTLVRAGAGGVNRFSSPIDTTPMKPGTKTITVTQMTGDPEKGDYGPGTTKATTTFTLKGAYLTTESPVKATIAKGDYIRLDPIGDRSVGDQFVITGTTSLPTGTAVFWQIIPDTGTPPVGISKSARGIMANGQVTQGDGTANRVSLAVDLTGHAPGPWVAQVGELKGEMNSGNFEMGELTGTVYFMVK